MMRWSGSRPYVLLICALLLMSPQKAAACTIDNVASLIADGVPAMRNTASPRPHVPWAPFVFAQAIAVGEAVQLTEAVTDLARTLPASVRAAPYRWTFGDGQRAAGYTVRHHYRWPGLYQLTVSGYDPVARRWFAFDQALLRVVSAQQLLQANLEYMVLRTVITFSGLSWPLNGLLVAIVMVMLVRRSRMGRQHGGWPRHQSIVRKAGSR